MRSFPPARNRSIRGIQALHLKPDGVQFIAVLIQDVRGDFAGAFQGDFCAEQLHDFRRAFAVAGFRCGCGFGGAVHDEHELALAVAVVGGDGCQDFGHRAAVERLEFFADFPRHGERSVTAERR